MAYIHPCFVLPGPHPRPSFFSETDFGLLALPPSLPYPPTYLLTLPFQNYHVSPVLAGYISALSPLVVVVFAPLAGLILDKWGHQLYVLLMANSVTIVAYVLLLQVREEITLGAGY